MLWLFLFPFHLHYQKKRVTALRQSLFLLISHFIIPIGCCYFFLIVGGHIKYQFSRGLNDWIQLCLCKRYDEPNLPHWYLYRHESHTSCGNWNCAILSNKMFIELLLSKSYCQRFQPSRFDVLPPALPIFTKFSRFIIKFWKLGENC